MTDDEEKRLRAERDNAIALAGTATQLFEKLSTENGALKRRVAELESFGAANETLKARIAKLEMELTLARGAGGTQPGGLA